MNRVPDLPYWSSEIHTALETEGYISIPAPRARLYGPFWVSEFRNFYMEVNGSSFIAGISDGGGGPAGGAGGYVITPSGNVRIPYGIYSKNYRGNQGGGSWRASSDMGIRGFKVTDDDVRSLGLDPDQIAITSRNVRVSWGGRVDHGAAIGEYRFNMSNPWSGLSRKASGVEGGKGRGSLYLNMTLTAPRDDEIVLPYWTDYTVGGGGGSHDITMSMTEL